MYKNLKKIAGWFAQTDYEIFATLLSYQIKNSYHGSVIEIGAHHGKSFIPLVKSNNSQRAYVIDIFGNQQWNADYSGKGDIEKFKKNLERFNVLKDGVIIDARMSSDVKPDDILSKVGKARFFHIDGGHHLSVILSDINLALAVCDDYAVIAIDDVFRPEWPEVSMGVFGSTALKENGFVPFAIGFNKTYWCKTVFVSAYHAALLENDLLASLLRKTYAVGNSPVLIFQRYPLPEWGLHVLASWFLEIYHPDWYVRICPIVKYSKLLIKKILERS